MVSYAYKVTHSLMYTHSPTHPPTHVQARIIENVDTHTQHCNESGHSHTACYHRGFHANRAFTPTGGTVQVWGLLQ
jgi:hypothetical protein